MGKGKLQKFAEMETFKNVFQYPFSVISDVPFEMKGHWREQYFKNDHPIVLELGCGRGEYAVGLARMYPDINFIGVDIKGARMYTGAKQALEEGLENVAFLRTSIEIIDRFFSEDEVQELWLTFSDPQMKNPRKRLTSTYFMERYRRFLVDGGIVNLKTDSNFLFTYKTSIMPHPKVCKARPCSRSILIMKACGWSAASTSGTYASACRAKERSTNPMWRFRSTNTAATTVRNAVRRTPPSNVRLAGKRVASHSFLDQN